MKTLKFIVLYLAFPFVSYASHQNIPYDERLDKIDRFGNNKLHYFICCGMYQEIENILKSDPELLLQKNNDGKTPLDIAREEQKQKIVELIIRFMAKRDES